LMLYSLFSNDFLFIFLFFAVNGDNDDMPGFDIIMRPILHTQTPNKEYSVVSDDIDEQYTRIMGSIDGLFIANDYFHFKKHEKTIINDNDVVVSL